MKKVDSGELWVCGWKDCWKFLWLKCKRNLEGGKKGGGKGHYKIILWLQNLWLWKLIATTTMIIRNPWFVAESYTTSMDPRNFHVENHGKQQIGIIRDTLTHLNPKAQFYNCTYLQVLHWLSQLIRVPIQSYAVL